jgi:hypothetical protein
MRGAKNEITVRCYATEIIQSQYGTIPILEWLMLEAKRMNAHGKSVEILQHRGGTYSIAAIDKQETSPGECPGSREQSRKQVHEE